MSTPEWLRPVSERYLGGEWGPPPLTVRIAVGLAAGNTLATGTLAVGSGVLVHWAATSTPYEGANLLAALLPGLVLTTAAVVFAASTVLLIPRGWQRPPLFAGLAVVVVTLLGACIALVPFQGTELQPDPDWSLTGRVLSWLLTSCALAIALVLVLRTDSASSWLAARRHRRRTRSG